MKKPKRRRLPWFPRPAKKKRIYKRKPRVNFSRVDKQLFTRVDDAFVKYDDGHTETSTYTADQYFDWFKQRSYGDNTPGYREQIKLGKNATTSANNYDHEAARGGNWYWQLTGRFEHPSPAVAQTRRLTYRGRYMPAVSAANSFIPSDMDNESIARFIAKARKKQTSILSGEVIHDWAKTCASFVRVRQIFLRVLRKHTLDTVRLREQLLGGRYGRRHTKKQATKKLAENWLEFNYGIKPTISDLEDSAFACWRIYDRVVNRPESAYAVGKAQRRVTSETSVSVPMQNAFALTWASITVKQQITTDLEVALYGGIRLRTSDQTDSSNGIFTGAKLALDEFGLNMSSFVPTLWELIPYSFVVDYFTNVGQVIDCLCFPRSDVLWVNRRIRNQVHTVNTPIPELTTPGNWKIVANTFFADPWETNTKFVSRNIYLGSLVPSFRLHLPFRDTDWLNMLALIAQAASSR